MGPPQTCRLRDSQFGGFPACGLATGFLRRGLEYGVWAPVSTEIYGSKRENTVFHEHLHETCFVLTEISESLRRPPVSLRESAINLGILYSSFSSLLILVPDRLEAAAQKWPHLLNIAQHALSMTVLSCLKGN